MPNVDIIDENNKLIATYPVTLGGLNYRASKQEFYDAALKCAVEDGLVNEADKTRFTFSVHD